MIDSGEWQTDKQPHLSKSINEYKKMFSFGFWFKEYKFMCHVLVDKNKKTFSFFIFPYYRDFKEKTLVITDIINENPYFQNDIYNLDKVYNDKLKNFLYNNFRESKIFFSDDLCGTEFKQVINFNLKR